MQFHNYATIKVASYRGTSQEYIARLFATDPDTVPVRESVKVIMAARGVMEYRWLETGRPFYNVYPIAAELCQRTSLRMKWEDIPLPVCPMALRFAAGYEPFGIRSALITSSSRNMEAWSAVKLPPGYEEMDEELHTSKFSASAIMTDDTLGLGCGGDGTFLRFNDDTFNDTIGAALEGMSAHGVPYTTSYPDVGPFLIKLAAFVGMLAQGNDLITPAILAADRHEYDTTSDEARKRWLEDRAARRLGGRGFDVGRQMQEDSRSPHWRMPHLALFHTGPGRTVPRLRMRAGGVVMPRHLSEVPTGYLGAELPGEVVEQLPYVFRPSIPSRLRYLVMRRDKYTCQLCGRKQEHGVTLEVDHKVPVARGGKTVMENLWVLCNCCNNGKSDLDLYEPGTN